MYHKLQYITQGKTCNEHLLNVKRALEAGCKWVQLRIKNTSEEEVLEAAIGAKHLCDQHNAVLIMNDNVEIAKKSNADGVHLGLTDMPVLEARAILGAGKIIGGTANTLAHIRQRVEENCDYIGLGPFRFTSTKEKLSPILGPVGYMKIMSALKLERVKIPVYAIGGILAEDIAGLIETGVYGVALSGALTASFDAAAFIDKINMELYANT